MNATLKPLVVAGALAAIGSVAFAQEATSDAWQQAALSKSRDQVATELAAAKKDGTIKAVTLTYDFVSRSPSVKSRDEVRAEAIAARESGETAAMYGEAYSFTAKSTVARDVYAKAH